MSTSPKSASGSSQTARLPRDIATDLVLASRMITAARDYSDMALGVMYTVAQGMGAVGLTLFDRDAGGLLRRRSLAALVTVDGTAAVDPGARVDLLPSAEHLETLRRGLPVFYDLSQADALSRQELDRLGVGWMASFGLRVDDDVLGTLDILHSQPHTFNTEEIDAYTMLADHIGVAVQGRYLFSQTQAALDETRRLYEINRAILSAQDMLDVLRALRQHLAPDALIISHLFIRYNERSRIEDVVLDYINLPEDEQVTQISLRQFLSPQELDQLHDHWHRTSSPITLVEDLNAPGIDDPLSHFSQQYGLSSYVSIALHEQGLVREAISLGFSQARVFTEQERRLYESTADQINILLQTQRLMRETQVTAHELSQRVRLLQIVNQLAITVSTTQDEKQLLDQSCRAIVEATGCGHCAIAIITPSETSAQVVSEHPLHGAIGVHIPLANNTMYDQMRADFQPVIIADVNNDDRLPPASLHQLERRGVHAMIVLPLMVQDRLVGSVGLDIYDPNQPVTQQMVEAGQTITVQVALGLQNTRLLADTQRRAEQLQRITAFSQSVQATLDLPTILKSALAESAQMLAQDQIRISLYDAASDTLRLVAEHTGGRTLIDLAHGEGVVISGHIARALNNQEMVHISDTHQLREPGMAEASAGIRSWLLAPIVTREGVTGLVSAGSAHPYAYTETDVVLFQQMVTQLAVAIENTTAYTQSQRMVRNESLLNTISTQLQNQIDIEQMMNVAVTELGQALGARRGRIRLGTGPASSPTNGSS